MDDLHGRLIRIGLAALADDFGFALAGGYAVQVHRIVQRLSDDVDLFTAYDRREQMPAATDRLVAAYEREGFQVEVASRAQTYVRLHVLDPEGGRETKVELVAEFLSHPPISSAWGPVLHRDDVAAGKMSALFSRAEARDFIDVEGLLCAGYTRQQLIELAAERDGGFDVTVLAEMFASISRFSDRQFAVYGIDAANIVAIRETFGRWRDDLFAEEAIDARATAARMGVTGPATSGASDVAVADAACRPQSSPPHKPRR